MSYKTFSNDGFKIRLVDMGRIFLSNGRALWPLSGIQVAEERLCCSFDWYFVSVCSLELSSSTGLSSSWPERFLLWGGTLNVLRFQAASSLEVQMMEKRMTLETHPLHLLGENNGKKSLQYQKEFCLQRKLINTQLTSFHLRLHWWKTIFGGPWH